MSRQFGRCRIRRFSVINLVKLGLTLTIEFQLAFSNLQLTYTHATFFTLDRVPSCKRAMMTSLAVHVLL